MHVLCYWKKVKQTRLRYEDKVFQAFFEINFAKETFSSSLKGAFHGNVAV